MAIRFIVTDAGRAALTNDDNTGTGARKIAEIGLGHGQYTAGDRTRADLVDPIKRIDTIAGEVVAPDTIHVTLQDESNDSYSVGEIGLFLDNGVLFAYFSQPDDWIIEKASPATLLLANDIEFADIDVSSLTFGDAAFLNPPASETVQGVIEIATQAEVDAGTDRRRAVVPRTLKAFIDKVLAAYATVKQLTDHAASRDHPAATTSAQGMVELATYAEAKEGSDNTRAVTPAADKAALDQHRTEIGAHAADRISLASLSKLGNPKTAQAGFAALGSAAVRDEGAGNGLDADKLDGLESDQFLRSDKGNTRIPFGTTSDTNWDGLVYDEGDNTVAFYADQTPGTDTPRALLGPGYIEAAGDRFYDNGNLTIKGKAKAGTLEIDGDVSINGTLDMHNKNIVNANSYTINDGGYGEGFMLPGWSFVENSGYSYIRDDTNGNNILGFDSTFIKAYRSIGIGSSPGKDFDNGTALALGDDDSGIRGNGDGQIEVWANNSEQLRIFGDVVRILNELTVSSALTVSGAKGIELYADINARNKAIVNVDKVVINDDGLSEGFMLPDWSFVQNSGHAYIRNASDGTYGLACYSDGSSKAFGKLQVDGGITTNDTLKIGQWNDAIQFMDLTSNGNFYITGPDGHGNGDDIFQIKRRGKGDYDVYVNGKGKIWHADNFDPASKLGRDDKAVDSDKLDGLHASQFYRSDVGNAEFRMGSGGSTNWDGIVYDEGDNTLAFYADQEPGKDTPRVTLGPGWIEAAGNRVWHDGNSKRTSSYVVFPNGLIIQWGNASSNSGNSSVKTDFPIPFPNDCLIAIGCDNEDSYPDPVGIGWSRTQVSVTTDENGVSRYIAIGY